MARTSSRAVAGGVGRAVGAGLAALGLGWGPSGAVAQAPAEVKAEAKAPVKPQFQLWHIAVIPRPIAPMSPLGVATVQDELKLDDTRKKEVQVILERRPRRVQEARREHQDRGAFRAARAVIQREERGALRAALTPGQCARLDQIYLQLVGPIAFAAAEPGAPEDLGPSVAERLGLSDDQARSARKIAGEGMKEIARASRFPIPLPADAKGGTPDDEAIRKLVESPEFRAAKAEAIRATREARDAAIRRIEGVLTDAQRDAYRAMLGAPFDPSTLRTALADEAGIDLRVVTNALRPEGQRPDPDFDTKVAHPAYADASWGPRVLFDEAHDNFHTAGGRYRPFAELIAHDGYRVIPNGKKFTGELLAGGDILIIANARGVGGTGSPGASDSAFADAECDAVRDWVRAGGSLLLIADHAPFGSAAAPLAGRFGVGIGGGATSDPANSEGGETFLVFTRKNDLLGDHPITRGRDDSERIGRVQTFTGTSLKGPEGSAPILTLADTAVDLSFGDDKSASAAGRAQGLALPFGRGRVVVMGEAAELSAQLIGTEQYGMNVPGLDNRQMALNIMHWLSGLLEPRAGTHEKAGATPASP